MRRWLLFPYLACLQNCKTWIGFRKLKRRIVSNGALFFIGIPCQAALLLRRLITIPSLPLIDGKVFLSVNLGIWTEHWTMNQMNNWELILFWLADLCESMETSEVNITKGEGPEKNYPINFNHIFTLDDTHMGTTLLCKYPGEVSMHWRWSWNTVSNHSEASNTNFWPQERETFVFLNKYNIIITIAN